VVIGEARGKETIAEGKDGIEAGLGTTEDAETRFEL